VGFSGRGLGQAPRPIFGTIGAGLTVTVGAAHQSSAILHIAFGSLCAVYGVRGLCLKVPYTLSFSLHQQLGMGLLEPINGPLQTAHRRQVIHIEHPTGFHRFLTIEDFMIVTPRWQNDTTGYASVLATKLWWTVRGQEKPRGCGIGAPGVSAKARRRGPSLKSPLGGERPSSR
jgi:hypothetical protein